MEPVSFRSAKSSAIGALLQHRQLSRSELAKITGVSAATITDVTQHLLDLGLLSEQPVTASESRRGRPATLLAFQSGHAYFVGISITDVATPMVLTDLQGRILHRQPVASYKTPAEFTQAVRTAYRRMLKDARIPQNRVRGVGIAVSGIIDAESGVCRYSAALDWRDVPVSALIGKAIKLPAWIDNDANAVAISEKFFGLAREYQNFTAVVMGRTIGAAHYMHGMLYRGHGGGAGEIGHITIDPKGRPCSCGRNGCLDTLAGGAALRASARAHGLRITGMRDLEALAMHGNAHATRLLRHGGEALGTAIASLVQINSPQCVLFMDMEGFESGIFRTATRQAIENHILPRFLASTDIQFRESDAGFLARSAALIAAFEYLKSI